MTRFILLTFAFMGWVFYEMSGGSEFEPASARLTDIRTDPLKPTAVVSTRNQAEEAEAAFDPKDVEVTRVSLNLTSVEDVLSGKAKQNEQPEVIAAPETESTTEATIIQAAVQSSQDTEAPAIIPSLVTGADTNVTAPQTGAVITGVGGDLRQVKGNRINVRGGPGTNYDVVGRLVRNDEVEIIQDLGNGWVQMQAVDGSASGWVADFLLTSSR